jgi:heme A synthase
VRVASYGLLAAVVGQIALGALTVMLGVPVPVAVAHQAGAYIVCTAAVVCVTRRGARERRKQRLRLRPTPKAAQL